MSDPTLTLICEALSLLSSSPGVMSLARSRPAGRRLHGLVAPCTSCRRPPAPPRDSRARAGRPAPGSASCRRRPRPSSRACACRGARVLGLGRAGVLALDLEPLPGQPGLGLVVARGLGLPGRALRQLRPLVGLGLVGPPPLQLDAPVLVGDPRLVGLAHLLGRRRHDGLALGIEPGPPDGELTRVLGLLLGRPRPHVGERCRGRLVLLLLRELAQLRSWAREPSSPSVAPTAPLANQLE
jgi:hypothetical protein